MQEWVCSPLWIRQFNLDHRRQGHACFLFAIISLDLRLIIWDRSSYRKGSVWLLGMAESCKNICISYQEDAEWLLEMLLDFGEYNVWPVNWQLGKPTGFQASDMCVFLSALLEELIFSHNFVSAEDSPVRI